jgi:hypothetical protein
MRIIAPIACGNNLHNWRFYLLSGQASKIGISVSQYSYLNFQINYQLLLLGIAIVSLTSSYLLNPISVKSILSIGNISAAGAELKIFGIKQGDTG